MRVDYLCSINVAVWAAGPAVKPPAPAAAAFSQIARQAPDLPAMTRVPFSKRRNVRRRNNFLDNNALECAEIDRIFQIGETQTIVLVVAHTVLAELAHPNTPNEVRARGYRSLF